LGLFFFIETVYPLLNSEVPAMSNPGTDLALTVSEQLVQATALTFGTVASLLGIAAGSVVIFGLIIRAQPESQEVVRKGATPGLPAKPYTKASNKTLVMRASAK